MKIRTDPSEVYERIYGASRGSAEETLALIQRKLKALPLATGRLAGTYRLEVEDVTTDEIIMVLTSDSPYAAVIERGGWMRGMRGPHVSGSGKGRHIVRDTARRDWGRRLSKKLRA